MARDDALAREPVPTVCLFCWRPPAVSWGLRQVPPSWLAQVLAPASELEGVERPSGGGIAFHGSDVSLSVVVPRESGLPVQELLRAVCASGAELCRSYGVEAHAALHPAPGGGPRPSGRGGVHQERAARLTYCLAEPSPYAVLVAGRKVAGYALRRYAETWLVQGSLLVGPIPARLRSVMPEGVSARVTAFSLPLAEAAGRPLDPADVARRWADRWGTWWPVVSGSSLPVSGSSRSDLNSEVPDTGRAVPDTVEPCHAL